MKAKSIAGLALVLILILLMIVISINSCSKVPAGHVGVKVHLLGGAKGVDVETLTTGRYWVGWNEELYLFPTFTQNYTWTRSKSEGNPVDESITFDSEGMQINADVGLSYNIDGQKAALIFQKYRKGLDEITNIYLRNMIRDAFVKVACKYPVESVYTQKTAIAEEVEKIVRNQVSSIGIHIERIYLPSGLRLPDTIVAALNAKVAAKQIAEQRENELRETEAAAKKKIAEAQGTAEANRLLANSISPQLVQWEQLQITKSAVARWDGRRPTVEGNGGGLLLQIPTGR